MIEERFLMKATFDSVGADFIFIPEHPPSHDPWETQMCEVIHRVIIFSAVTILPHLMKDI